MKPSRIVKSAHARAGTSLTLKSFARHVVNGTQPASSRLMFACAAWLANKRAGKATTADSFFKPINGPGPSAEQIAETKFRREREKQLAKSGVPGWGVVQ